MVLECCEGTFEGGPAYARRTLHPDSQCGVIGSVSALVREVSCSLTVHCINNAPPDRLARLITLLRKFFRPYSAFYVSLVAVVFQHQVGDAPDAAPVKVSGGVGGETQPARLQFSVCNESGPLGV